MSDAKGKNKKTKKQDTKATPQAKGGGAGPVVRDKKEAVSKGASPARRSRGDQPR